VNFELIPKDQVPGSFNQDWYHVRRLADESAWSAPATLKSTKVFAHALVTGSSWSLVETRESELLMEIRRSNSDLSYLNLPAELTPP
jgi:hypothetical protein